MFPSDIPIEECRLTTYIGGLGAPWFGPLDIYHGDLVYDPFAYDVACMGRLLATHFVVCVAGTAHQIRIHWYHHLASHPRSAFIGTFIRQDVIPSNIKALYSFRGSRFLRNDRGKHIYWCARNLRASTANQYEQWVELGRLGSAIRQRLGITSYTTDDNLGKIRPMDEWLWRSWMVCFAFCQILSLVAPVRRSIPFFLWNRLRALVAKCCSLAPNVDVLVPHIFILMYSVR